MGGMALGSYLEDELLIGVWMDCGYLGGWKSGRNVFVAALFDNLVPIYRELYPALQTFSFLLTLVRLSLSSLLLILPTTFMGATFPILVRALVGRREELGQKLARLYTWNTLGSVIGSVVTGYFLVGLLGLNATTWLAAALNLVVDGSWRFYPHAIRCAVAAATPACPGSSRTQPRPAHNAACHVHGRLLEL
jgi:spermidine synthase